MTAHCTSQGEAGKDYIATGWRLTRSPHGTGIQLSVSGMLGFLVGTQEGLEINVLSLTIGLDPRGWQSICLALDALAEPDVPERSSTRLSWPCP